MSYISNNNNCANQANQNIVANSSTTTIYKPVVQPKTKEAIFEDACVDRMHNLMHNRFSSSSEEGAGGRSSDENDFEEGKVTFKHCTTNFADKGKQGTRQEFDRSEPVPNTSREERYGGSRYKE